MSAPVKESTLSEQSQSYALSSLLHALKHSVPKLLANREKQFQTIREATTTPMQQPHVLELELSRSYQAENNRIRHISVRPNGEGRSLLVTSETLFPMPMYAAQEDEAEEEMSVGDDEEEEKKGSSRPKMRRAAEVRCQRPEMVSTHYLSSMFRSILRTYPESDSWEANLFFLVYYEQDGAEPVSGWEISPAPLLFKWDAYAFVREQVLVMRQTFHPFRDEEHNRTLSRLLKLIGPTVVRGFTEELNWETHYKALELKMIEGESGGKIVPVRSVFTVEFNPFHDPNQIATSLMAHQMYYQHTHDDKEGVLERPTLAQFNQLQFQVGTRFSSWIQQFVPSKSISCSNDRVWLLLSTEHSSLKSPVFQRAVTRAMECADQANTEFQKIFAEVQQKQQMQRKQMMHALSNAPAGSHDISCIEPVVDVDMHQPGGGGGGEEKHDAVVVVDDTPVSDEQVPLRTIDVMQTVWGVHVQPLQSMGYVLCNAGSVFSSPDQWHEMLQLLAHLQHDFNLQQVQWCSPADSDDLKAWIIQQAETNYPWLAPTFCEHPTPLSGEMRTKE